MLAVGACTVFLFSGCATSPVKGPEEISEPEQTSKDAEQGLVNQRISELEAELANEKVERDQERALLNEEISRLRGSTESSAGQGSVQTNAPNAREESVASLQAELARLRFLNELLLEASGTSTPTIKPAETPLTVGTGRIRVTQAVINSGFVGFLSAENRPDDRGRASASSAQAVGVSWLDAVRYCNWLSAQWQYDAYYFINGTEVQLNPNGRRNGYRLPSQAELDASVRNGFLSMDAVSRVGLLSSEPNRAYRYDRTRNSLVPLDASLPVNNIGFMVVRNEN
jgi:hypothetical protein